ncbi:MAG TPA: dihydrodipicolinate synthase family protein [Roseiflexaceae bacterium]|nr:dihydrodipicolinate synthase family protein [Roseiflexaceae bacterium]
MPELFAASVTPFVSTAGAVDHAWIPRHLRWMEANGVDGVVPCGTTGEGPSLGVAERMAVIDTVLAHRGRLAVIPGTGCAALPETIALTRYAIERGADAALVLPPFYFKGMSDAGLLEYFRAVCDALPAGGKILLYHIPPVSQVAIPPAVIDGLLESHPGALLGLKDSGGDPAHTAMLCARYPQLKIYTGGPPLTSRALADGAAGGIYALTNIFPRELRALLDAHAAGQSTEEPQRRVSALSEALRPYGNVPAVKALLPHVAGLPATAPRAPQLPLSSAEAEALLERVRAVA